MLKRNFLVIALAGSGLVTGQADARPATCLLEIDGQIYMDGPCDFESFDGGSFTVTPPGFSKVGGYFATMLLDGKGQGQAYWNETPEGQRAHAPLGVVYRDDACWANSNDTVILCAW